MQSPSPEALAAGPRRAHPGARLLAWRLPPIETYPALVAFVQTVAGKLVLFAAFAALMKLDARGMWIENGYAWLLLTLAAAIVSLAGRYRHAALLVCGVAVLARQIDWIEFTAVWEATRQENLAAIRFLRIGAILAFFALAAAAIFLARRCREHPLASRPVLAQHILYCCLLCLAASHWLGGVPQVLLWGLVAVYSAWFSFLAYALLDQRQRQPSSLPWQLATFNPFCWPTPVPMGKGAAYWRSVEAATAAELAVTQLKGLKLLAWALALKLMLWIYRWALYEQLGVPPLKAAFGVFLDGGAVPAPLGFFSVVANFPEQLLQVAIWGHVIVGAMRLAGFRILRNTCRPLSARTIAEFWNRYLYYFKEVLVHVYFYPTFVRCFRKHPRLRIAFATFMAAGVGNYFLHFVLQTPLVVRHGLIETLVRSQTYAFYCIMLVAGIVASQVRTRAPDPGAGFFRARVLPPLGVAAFFCFLSFFDGPQGHASLAKHFEFLMHVIRVDGWIRTTG